MKIFVIVQNLSTGGVARLVVDEINELTRRGDRVWLVFFESAGVSTMPLSECRLPSERIIYFVYPRMRAMGRLWALTRLIKSVKPDAVLTHMWFANTVGRTAAFLAGAPHIYAFEHSVYDTVKPRKQFMIDFLLQGLSTGVIAVSDAVRTSLIRHGIRSARITVLDDGIDLERYARPLSIARDASHEFRFIFIGRLVLDKGVDVFLNALAHVPGAKAVVAGDGSERRTLQEQAVALGLGARTQFLGMRNDIPALLASSDALVVPSRREGFGLVVVEARAAGVPVIATGVVPKDLVADGVTGLVVAPNDIDALASAMNRMRTDAPLRARLIRHGSEDLSKYSIATHVDGLRTLLTTHHACKQHARHLL